MIAFYVSNLEQTRSTLIEKGVQVTELVDHGGITTFAFIDNEGRGFAVLDSK